MTGDTIETALDTRPYTVGSAELRFHGTTILDRANLIEIFEKIAGTPQGAVAGVCALMADVWYVQMVEFREN
jgi:hypothetical protein